jgi:hypothetical protein
MLKFIPAVALSAFLAAPVIAHADPFNNDVAVSLGVGTEGIGGELAVPLIRHTLNLNIGYSGFSDNFHFTADQANFHAKLRLGAVPLVLSVYPFHGNFSLDAGANINFNQVSAIATANYGATYTINHTTYTAAEIGSLSGKTHFNTVAPYVGIGWGDPFEGGRWTFLANAGAVYEGAPAVRLIATGAASDPRLASDVAAAQNSVNHQLNFLHWWPIISIAVAYRF